MKNFEWCVYTYRHRKAFEYTVNKLIKDPELKAEMLKRAKVHDVDKLKMYLVMDHIESQKKHVSESRHHLENDNPKSYEDLVETVIDYECAPYTKPDKPLNAYDFTKKLLSMGAFGQETADKLISIMHEFGIDSSYDLTKSDPEGMAYVQSIGEVTEEMILDDIRENG